MHSFPAGFVAIFHLSPGFFFLLTGFRTKDSERHFPGRFETMLWLLAIAAAASPRSVLQSGEILAFFWSIYYSQVISPAL